MAEDAVYVYGIIPAKARSAVSVTGVADRQVRLIGDEGVAALVSDFEDGALAAAREVRRHWRVLEEASKAVTVLPVRFGTAMEDDAAVREQLLEPHAERLEELLAELEGRVQLNLKGGYHEERLLREVVAGSRAISRLRERVRTLPEAAGYYQRIRLGELIAAEVARRREEDTGVALTMLEPLAVAARAEEPRRGAAPPGRGIRPGVPRRSQRHRLVQPSRRRARRADRQTDRAPLRGPVAALQLRPGRAERGGRPLGLITGLLTLPLAPVRGTIWLAERLEEKAYEEMTDETGLHQALLELEAARERGELGEDEVAETEDALIERFMAIRGYQEEDEYGRF